RHEGRGSAATGTLVCGFTRLPHSWCATRAPGCSRAARTTCSLRGWLLLAQLPEMPHSGTGEPNRILEPKLWRNRLRDRRVGRELRRLGWTPLRLWEHEVQRDYARSAARVLAAVTRLEALTGGKGKR